MSKPLNYARLPKPKKPHRPLLALAVIFSLVAMILVGTAFVQALAIQDQGRFRPSVSFSNSLPLKTYYVQRPAIVWLLPIASALICAWELRLRQLFWMSLALFLTSLGLIAAMLAMQRHWP